MDKFSPHWMSAVLQLFLLFLSLWQSKSDTAVTLYYRQAVRNISGTILQGSPPFARPLSIALLFFFWLWCLCLENMPCCKGICRRACFPIIMFDHSDWLLIWQIHSAPRFKPHSFFLLLLTRFFIHFLLKNFDLVPVAAKPRSSFRCQSPRQAISPRKICWLAHPATVRVGYI